MLEWVGKFLSFCECTRRGELEASRGGSKDRHTSEGYLDGPGRCHYDVRLAEAPVFVRILENKITFRRARTLHTFCP